MNSLAHPTRGMLALLLAAICALALGCQQTGTQKTGEEGEAATATAKTEDPVARGKYLVTVGSCNDCHTPWHMGPNGPEPNMALMLSGHPSALQMPSPPKVQEPWQAIGSATFTAWAGPWGISYAANLTPDMNTGMGSWTEEMFMKAMRTGKHLGAERPILPPMPWPSVAAMTDEDLKAVFAFLRSIPAIPNAVPDPVITPPPGTTP